MSSPTTDATQTTQSAATESATPLSAEIESPTIEQYQQSVLSASIKAARLLDELIGISIIPDPRVKDAAEIALKLIELTNKQVSDGTLSDTATAEEKKVSSKKK